MIAINKIFLYNLIPPFIMDIVYAIIANMNGKEELFTDLLWILIISQVFVIMPFYYACILVLFHFKYKYPIRDVLKTEFISVLVLPVMFAVILGVISGISQKFEDIIIYEILCILSYGITLFVGVIIVAVVSYLRKKKQ